VSGLLPCLLDHHLSSTRTFPPTEEGRGSGEKQKAHSGPRNGQGYHRRHRE